MADLHVPGYWDHSRATVLIAGLLLPPLAWLLDMQVSYSLVKWACAHDRQWILFVLPAGSLTLIAVTTLMSWQTSHQTNHHARHLLALSGLAMSILFGVLIIVSLAPRVLLSPCE
jgi:ABC-type Fe3+-siderophore transport system permease subunit